MIAMTKTLVLCDLNFDPVCMYLRSYVIYKTNKVTPPKRNIDFVAINVKSNIIYINFIFTNIFLSVRN